MCLQMKLENGEEMSKRTSQNAANKMDDGEAAVNLPSESVP